MNINHVFLSKIHATYFLIFAISVGSALAFIRLSLIHNAETSLQQFLQSNKDEIASSSSMELATKLNALMASENIACVSGKIQNNYFIESKKGRCNSSLFISESTFKSPNNNLLISISYSLSNYLLISTLSFIFGEILLFIYLLKISKEKLTLEIKSKKILISLSQKLAHDIRSPISTLNLISSKIENEDIKSLQLAVVNQINTIANDLLHESKEKGPLSISKDHSTRCFEKMLQNIEKEYEIKANAIKQSIRFEINYNEVSKCHLDQKLSSIIYRSLNNFIQNAIEATKDDGSIVISAHTNSKGRLEISVKDNGKGIPKDILNRLGQEVLSHGKSNRSETHQSGNGIALYNSKKELSEFNVELSIESELNNGSTIRIII